MDAWKNTKTFYLRSTSQRFEEIVWFENNPFMTMRSKDQLVYTFPLQECISLEYLMYAFEHKFIQIFRGQVLLIVQMILQHYIDMLKKNIHHGNLSPANIWIHLGGTARFSTYARKQEFLKIYFVDYQEESNTQKNKSENLNFALAEFLTLTNKDFGLSNKDFQLESMQFSNEIFNCQTVENYQKLYEQMQKFLEQNMDQKKQMLRNNFDYKEVGYQSSRYILETYIKESITKILTCEQTEVVGGEEDMQLTPLYSCLLQILTNFRMKEIIKDFGKALENNYFGVSTQDVTSCLNRINPKSKEFLKIVEKLFKKEKFDKQVQQLKEFIKSFNEEIEITFKLEIKIAKDPEQILFDSWVDWIQTNLVSDPPKIQKEDIQKVKKEIQTNSKNAYIKMYDEQFEMKIQKLIEELL